MELLSPDEKAEYVQRKSYTAAVQPRSDGPTSGPVPLNVAISKGLINNAHVLRTAGVTEFAPCARSRNLVQEGSTAESGALKLARYAQHRAYTAGQRRWEQELTLLDRVEMMADARDAWSETEQMVAEQLERDWVWEGLGMPAAEAAGASADDFLGKKTQKWRVFAYGGQTRGFPLDEKLVLNEKDSARDKSQKGTGALAPLPLFHVDGVGGGLRNALLFAKNMEPTSSGCVRTVMLDRLLRHYGDAWEGFRAWDSVAASLEEKEVELLNVWVLVRRGGFAKRAKKSETQNHWPLGFVIDLPEPPVPTERDLLAAGVEGGTIADTLVYYDQSHTSWDTTAPFRLRQHLFHFTVRYLGQLFDDDPWFLEAEPDQITARAARVPGSAKIALHEEQEEGGWYLFRTSDANPNPGMVAAETFRATIHGAVQPALEEAGDHAVSEIESMDESVVSSEASTEALEDVGKSRQSMEVRVAIVREELAVEWETKARGTIRRELDLLEKRFWKERQATLSRGVEERRSSEDERVEEEALEQRWTQVKEKFARKAGVTLFSEGEDDTIEGMSPPSCEGEDDLSPPSCEPLDLLSPTSMARML